MNRSNSSNFGSEGIYYYVSAKYHSIEPSVFETREQLRDYEINVCEKVINGCRVSEGAFDKKEREIIADLTKRGYLHRTENGESDFEVTIPHYTAEQEAMRHEQAKAAVAPVYDEFMACADELYEYWLKQIPERLRPTAPVFYPSHHLLAVCMEKALHEGLIKLPKEPYCECLIQRSY